jgi:hypothetical protein
MALFSWFRRKPARPELTLNYVAAVLKKYGTLLEEHPTAYIDQSRLPVPKSEMRRVLQAAWKMAPELRKTIEVGWISLYRFQSDIGRVPIDANPDKREMLNRFVEISKTAQREMERDFEELSAFKRTNQR